MVAAGYPLIPAGFISTPDFFLQLLSGSSGRAYVGVTSSPPGHLSPT